MALQCGNHRTLLNQLKDMDQIETESPLARTAPYFNDRPIL